MNSFLKKHPFAVEAFFESSLVLTFAVPKEELKSLIPECLELDTFQEKWGFIAVAMVETKDLRPKGLPKIFGNDFFLIGYRIFVRYINNLGKSLRGLYILKSETDKKKMEILGNIFTRYSYNSTDIFVSKEEKKIKIKSIQSKLDLTIEIGGENILLPVGSPFAYWEEARRFAGPLPFTFSYEKKTRTVLIIEGLRENWLPKPVAVLNYEISFLQEFKFKDIRLANAFIIYNIPYYWKKGRTEKWMA